MLDNDCYKFTMQKGLLFCPIVGEKTAVYKLFNRGPKLSFSSNTIRRAMENAYGGSSFELCNIFGKTYYSCLEEMSKPHVSEAGNEIFIRGKWQDAILMEVPLMAAISEESSKHKFPSQGLDYVYQQAELLKQNDIQFAEGGTRRRCSAEFQDEVVNLLSNYPNFIGTSNVGLALKYNVRPVGTIAHEMYMGTSALAAISLVSSANATLPMATLTDTHTTESFVKNDQFAKIAEMCSVFRQDSGCPEKWAETMMQAFSEIGIDPTSKTFIFSDSLNAERCVEINNYIHDRYSNSPELSFLIGTNFTNPNEERPNFVIKLVRLDGKKCVKIGDGDGKRTEW